MISIGYWTGQYKYDRAELQRTTSCNSTNFEIEITAINNNNFIGKVQDDLSTGGTEGIGEIRGKVSGEKIKFVKQMPILTVINPKNGTRKTFNKKHRKIYYQGVLLSDEKSISGQWRLKFGFIWIWFIPIPVSSTKGTWTMMLKK